MKKIFLLLIMVLVSFVVPGFTEGQEPSQTVVELPGVDIKQSVVRVRGYEGVSPLNMFIKPGTVVVWLNQYRGHIKVTFPEKKVTLACRSPVNFTVNEQGIFISNTIPFGAVASLCFVERGTYAYVVERMPVQATAQSEGFRFEGTIVVK